jgi:hypothetical protein
VERTYITRWIEFDEFGLGVIAPFAKHDIGGASPIKENDNFVAHALRVAEQGKPS